MLTFIIIGLTVLISYPTLNRPDQKVKFSHYPYVEKRERQYFRMISSGFFHGDSIHLIVNMVVLYSFGQSVENKFAAIFGQMGGFYFILFYVSAIFFANVLSYFKQQDNPNYSAIGASGAVSAMLSAHVLFEPWSTLLLYFAIPIPALIALVAYLWYSTWAAKKSRDNIDHMAHFTGAVYGFIFPVLIHFAFLPEFVSKFLEFNLFDGF